MPEQAGWLATRSGAVFAGLHLPDGPARSTAVLLAPPFGWEGLSAARNLRGWARALAASGHPVLRYAPPGSGDSEGVPAEQDLRSWVDALTDVATQLRAATGCASLAVIGLGLGGLATLQAVSDGLEVDQLVLWATPRSGRLWLREVKAFAALAQDPGYADDGRPPRPAEEVTTPDGTLWVHGFPLSMQAQAQLTQLDTTALQLGRVRRALLLGRGTLPVDKRLAASLTESVGEVTTSAGPGYDELTVEPRLSLPPQQVVRQVSAWLQDTTAAPPPVTALTWVTPPGERALDLGGFPAVLHAAEGSPVTAVFLTSGAVPRCGPHQLWTDTARRWAAKGISSLRVDLQDVGEGPGADVFPHGPEGSYHASYREQVREVLEAAVRAGLPARFVLVGMCSGAYWAIDAAVDDERVAAVASLNGSLVWPPPLSHVSGGRLLNAGTLKRLVTEPALLREVLRWCWTLVGRALARFRRAARPATPVAIASALLGRGTLLALAATTGDPFALQYDDLPRRSGLVVAELHGPEGAHTMATPGLRAQALGFLDTVAERVATT